MSDYTKGEWKWEWESGQPTVRAHDPKDPLKLIATVYPKQRKKISLNSLIDEEAEVNARLIAQAPRLYEALKEWVEYFVKFRELTKETERWPILERSQGILAKVEGK